MRRCPKCNRTYSTDTQKFCTHDGGLLFTVQPELTETVQFDSSKVRDAVAKPTTRDLSEQQAAAFDPEATVVSSGVKDGTQQVKARDTGSLEPPSQTQYYGAPPSQPSTGPVAPPPVTPSGPIPPPQTSAPLPPPPPQAQSGPIPPPPQAQAAAAGHPSHHLPPAAQKKKSKLPLILGILAVVIVLFVGAAVIVGYFVWKNQGREVAAGPATSGQGPSAPSLPSTATPSQASIPANEPPPYSPPPNAEQFVNSKTNLDGKLLEHYIDFSFYYPNTWQKDPEAGVSGASNFAKVERRLPPDFTQENFAVGWYSATGTSTQLFKNLAENLSKQLSTGFPEYRKVSEGPTRVGVYDGYEFRFEGMSRNTAKGDVKIWGRVVFLPPPSGGSTGVTLLMLTTSLAPELTSIDDVGVKGELPMVLESFRFGK